MKNNNQKNKKCINENKDKELSKLLKYLVLFIAILCIFGYIGYTFSLDNNYDLKKGIVFGALFAIGIAIIKKYDIGNFFIYAVYTVTYICIAETLPIEIGILLLFAIVLFFSCWFIYICVKYKRKDKNTNQEINTSKIYKNDYNYSYNPNIDINLYENNEEDKEYEFTLPEEEYYCERCDKRISEEEYEENCGLCEDCDSEVYFGERYDGDDYDLYR